MQKDIFFRLEKLCETLHILKATFQIPLFLTNKFRQMKATFGFNKYSLCIFRPINK